MAIYYEDLASAGTKPLNCFVCCRSESCLEVAYPSILEYWLPSHSHSVRSFIASCFLEAPPPPHGAYATKEPDQISALLGLGAPLSLMAALIISAKAPACLILFTLLSVWCQL